MLSIPLFACFGFMLAVLYIDLVFDMSALPHRKSGAPLPAEVLSAIETYYRYVTRNPYLLGFVMMTALACLVAELVWDLVPRATAWASLGLMGLAMSAATLKVIPTAQRLAAGKDDLDRRTRMVHSILPFHLLLLACIVTLAGLQFFAVAGR